MTTISKADLKLFIAWLKTKPKYEHYSYVDNEDCPIAQYLKYLGHTNVSVNPYAFSTRTIFGRELPGGLNNILQGSAPGHGTVTENFGALLKRANRALQKL